MTSVLGKGHGSCRGILESQRLLQTLNSWISFLTGILNGSVSLGNKMIKNATLNYDLSAESCV